MSYDFNAETTGVIIGRRQGYNQGYDEGFKEADKQWKSQNNEWKASHKNLEDACAELKRENAQLRATIQEANYALASLSIISMSTMEALKNAPQATITKLVLHYSDLSKNWLDGKYIRELPANEPVLQQHSPHIVSVMQKWWDQTLEATKPATQNNKNDSVPSP